MLDGGHRSLFTHRWMNESACIVFGSLLCLDGSDFRKTHNQHHAVAGMEDATDWDPDLMVLWTTKEWADWPRGLSKLAARVLRDPLFFYILVAPIFAMIFNAAWPHRVTHQSTKARALYLLGRMAFVAARVRIDMALSGGLGHFLGETAAYVFLSAYAVFLASAEHIYEGVYVKPRSEYDRTDAAVVGSSCIIMPWWWQWATFGFEYHHIHHLNTHVPGYRIKECHESAPPELWEELGLTTLTWRSACHTLILSLWNPDAHRFEPFPEWLWLERLLMPELYSPAVTAVVVTRCVGGVKAAGG